MRIKTHYVVPEVLCLCQHPSRASLFSDAYFSKNNTNQALDQKH